MIRILTAILLTFSIFPATPKSDSLSNPIVLIKSGSETATGMLLGNQGETLYFLTVEHAIENPGQIELQFFSGEKAVGKVFKVTGTWDIAVVICQRPPGWKIPNSFALAKRNPIIRESVITIGHPLENDWDINYRNEVKKLSYDYSPDFFTLTPDGITSGSSGGPVLNEDKEFMGMVKQRDNIKAVCIARGLIMRILSDWNVPINRMLGISEETNSTDGEQNILYKTYLYEADFHFEKKNWAKAERAYREVDKIRPSNTLKAKIKSCQTEVEKDRQYLKLRDQGLNTSNPKTRLDIYLQAQKQRNTSEIQSLIRRTRDLLSIPDPIKSVVENTSIRTKYQTYKDDLAGEMIFVEGGSFQMGSKSGSIDEKPVHPVIIPNFYLGKFEVTQEKWERIMGENPSFLKKGKNYPVENVSWNDVQKFIKKLNQQSSYTYRLPTEAEWEYAAGGGNGTRTTYAGTNDEKDLYKYGNYYESESGDKDKFEKTSPVGHFKSNQLGLYDMSGNVWEWCEDWYHNSYNNVPTDGSALLSLVASRLVVRGGSWSSRSRFLRIANRGSNSPDYRDFSIGLRLARTP